MPTDNKILSVLNVWAARRDVARSSMLAVDDIHDAAIRKLRALFAQPEPDVSDAEIARIQGFGEGVVEGLKRAQPERMSVRLEVASRIAVAWIDQGGWHNEAPKWCLRFADALIDAAKEPRNA